eukprot:jgi/Ulvmu1/8682/UM047_0022.1
MKAIRGVPTQSPALQPGVRSPTRLCACMILACSMHASGFQSLDAEPGDDQATRVSATLALFQTQRLRLFLFVGMISATWLISSAVVESAHFRERLFTRGVQQEFVSRLCG